MRNENFIVGQRYNACINVHPLALANGHVPTVYLDIEYTGTSSEHDGEVISHEFKNGDEILILDDDFVNGGNIADAIIVLKAIK